MNREALRDELSDLLAMQTHSLAQHLDHARPYLSTDTYPVWSDLQHLREESLIHARRVAGLFRRLRLEPHSKPYAQSLAHYHDMDLHVLVPLLLVEKREAVDSLARAVELAEGDSVVVSELKDLLEITSGQVRHLEQCLLRLHQAIAKS